MTIDSQEEMELSALKVALVIDMTPHIIKDPLNHMRVGKQGESILKDRV